MKQSLRSTVLSPPSRSDVLFASETKRSCKSLRVKRLLFTCGVRNEIYEIVDTSNFSTLLVSLAKRYV